MHQFVQSAIEAANQGDKNKAMSFLKEVISANPNDVDAWLVLAAVVDEPQRKRQCLNRVLSLDPVNKLAREELFEMDRASMGGTPPFTPEVDPVSQPKPQPAPRPSNQSMNMPVPQTPAPQQATHVSLPNFEQETPKPKAQAAPKPRAEKPLVFKYSTVTRVITYIFAAFFSCSFLFVLQDPAAILIPCGAFLIILPALWIVSKQVEVSEKGIRTSQLFGLAGSEVGWNEIARIQSNAMQSNLELITKKGNKVRVTSQVTGYPVIVETLRQKRPDLFGMAQPAPARRSPFDPDDGDSPSLGYNGASVTPSFSGTRTFKKNFFKQYGLLFLIVPFCVFALWTAYADQENRIWALLTAAFCVIMSILPFFQVGSVKVEPNKLTIETFVAQKELSAREIREIKMQSVRGRYGRVTNYVNVVTEKGKNYPMQGFSDGDEIIYGILNGWWETYRNR